MSLVTLSYGPDHFAVSIVTGIAPICRPAVSRAICAARQLIVGTGRPAAAAFVSLVTLRRGPDHCRMPIVPIITLIGGPRPRDRGCSGMPCPPPGRRLPGDLGPGPPSVTAGRRLCARHQPVCQVRKVELPCRTITVRTPGH